MPVLSTLKLSLSVPCTKKSRSYLLPSFPLKSAQTKYSSVFVGESRSRCTLSSVSSISFPVFLSWYLKTPSVAFFRTYSSANFAAFSLVIRGFSSSVRGAICPGCSPPNRVLTVFNPNIIDKIAAAVKPFLNNMNMDKFMIGSPLSKGERICNGSCTLKSITVNRHTNSLALKIQNDINFYSELPPFLKYCFGKSHSCADSECFQSVPPAILAALTFIKDSQASDVRAALVVPFRF